MRLFLKLTDKDLGLDEKVVSFEKSEFARAVLREGNKIALLYVSNYNYYKLPGGRIEKGEDIEGALRREIKEETGCTMEILGEIGKTMEFKSVEKVEHISYCFFGNVLEKGEPEFSQREVDAGFKLVWVTLDEAINLVKNSKPQTYLGKFIVKRDLAILLEAKRLEVV